MTAHRLLPPLLLALLAGCHPPPPAAPVPAVVCPGGSPWVREQLYLGRGLADGGEVSDSAWQRFLEDEIMPRFTEGLTLVEATGQWRSRAGPTTRERSWVLLLYHPAGEAEERKVEAVITAYKAAFAQEAVLRDRDMTCVTL
jgi:hypothetical protein